VGSYEQDNGYSHFTNFEECFEVYEMGLCSFEYLCRLSRKYVNLIWANCFITSKCLSVEIAYATWKVAVTVLVMHLRCAVVSEVPYLFREVAHDYVQTQCPDFTNPCSYVQEDMPSAVSVTNNSDARFV
jgi:hypothetical protein